MSERVSGSEKAQDLQLVAEEMTTEARLSGTLTDVELLERTRSGHALAFETLFHRHYGRVHGLLHRLVGDDADDLAQEVFLKLHQRPPGRLTEDLSAWLYRVATNAGYNALRSRRRWRHHRDAIGDSIDGMGWIRAEPAPDAWVESRETQRLVRSVLARLKRREAIVLALRYGGLSYREIARVMGVSPGSVGTLLARAERAFEKQYRRFAEPDASGGER